MEKRVSYFVSRRNVLTWLAVFLLAGSVGLRIANFCGKGTDTTTVWLQCVLPVAACLIFALQLLLDSQEHFYRTAMPVTLAALYFAAVVWAREDWTKRMIFVSILVYFAFVIFYRLITSGRLRAAWALPLMFLTAAAIQVYDGREAFGSGDLGLWLHGVADVALLAAGLLVTLAMQPHTDGRYHPTWGDRSDGRRVRTIPPMSRATPYIMKTRNDANNILLTEMDIGEMERYVREKRKEGMTGFGLNHAFIAAYVRCVAQYPQVNRFVSGREVYSRGDDIQYCMTVKKDMTLESPDTCIKLHLKPSDTAYDVYRKFEEVVGEVKNPTSENDFDKTAGVLSLLPGPVYVLAVKLLEILDYWGLLPKFLLEVSPFHGSVFFTSMGSLGIPAIVHHLYNFGNVPVFISFGRKYRRNELNADGTVETKKYVDMGFNLDERICDGFYYAAILKYMKRIFNDPWRLDNPPETVEEDIP